MNHEVDTKKIILDVKNLNTTFISDKKEVKIVKDVSFQLKRGTCLAVVGESGCGKSVTMNSIMRFTGRNAKVKADKIQYNALRDGQVTEYRLETIKKPNGPEMRALRGPALTRASKAAFARTLLLNREWLSRVWYFCTKVS